MNLHERLTEIRQAFETGDTPRETIEVLNENIEKLLAVDVTSKALQVGDQAPLDLSLQSSSAAVPLKNLLTRKCIVLNWFRGNW